MVHRADKVKNPGPEDQVFNVGINATNKIIWLNSNVQVISDVGAAFSREIKFRGWKAAPTDKLT